MMMLKRKNACVSFYDGQLENERACDLYECNPQEEPINKIAEAAYRQAECWSSGYRVPLEVWLQAEKKIDILTDAIYS
jgi:hypothetical protein